MDGPTIGMGRDEGCSWNFDLKVQKGKKLGKWTDQDIFWPWDKAPLNVDISLASR